MRISVVHSFYSSKQPSGENTIVDAQVEALRRGGHDVQLVSARTDDLSGSRGYAVQSGLTVATGIGRSPAGELQSFQPDVIHVHNLFPNWGSRWLRGWPGPIVATMHNFRPVCAAATLFRDGHPCHECPDTSAINAVVHACYGGSRIASVPLAIASRRSGHANPVLTRADRVVVLSQRARALYEGFGVDSDRIDEIPNFVQLPPISTSSPLGDRWIYIGRLAPEKGIVELLRHWPEGVGLDVYGDGPLASTVANLCSGSVTFHGSASRATVISALAGSAGLVFPSMWAEGLPTVYIEALAVGRPVVAFAGNSAADDVERASTGQVFERWDELATHLRAVASDAHRISLGASARYLEQFTEEVWLKRIEQAYETALSRR